MITSVGHQRSRGSRERNKEGSGKRGRHDQSFDTDLHRLQQQVAKSNATSAIDGWIDAHGTLIAQAPTEFVPKDEISSMEAMDAKERTAKRRKAELVYTPLNRPDDIALIVSASSPTVQFASIQLMFQSKLEGSESHTVNNIAEGVAAASKLPGAAAVAAVIASTAKCLESVRKALVDGPLQPIENREKEFATRLNDIEGLARRIKALEARGDIEGAACLDESCWRYTSELNHTILAAATGAANARKEAAATQATLTASIASAVAQTETERRKWAAKRASLHEDVRGFTTILEAIEKERQRLMGTMEEELAASEAAAQRAERRRKQILTSLPGLQACLAADLQLRRDQTARSNAFQMFCHLYADSMATLAAEHQTGLTKLDQYSRTLKVVDGALECLGRLSQLLESLRLLVDPSNGVDTAMESPLDPTESYIETISPVNAKDVEKYELTLLSQSYRLISRSIPRRHRAVRAADKAVAFQTYYLREARAEARAAYAQRDPVAIARARAAVAEAQGALSTAEQAAEATKRDFEAWVESAGYKTTRRRLADALGSVEPSVGPCALDRLTLAAQSRHRAPINQ